MRLLYAVPNAQQIAFRVLASSGELGLSLAAFSTF